MRCAHWLPWERRMIEQWRLFLFFSFWMLIFFFSPRHPVTSCPPRLRPLPGSLHLEEILLSESLSLTSAHWTGRSGDPFWSGSVSLVDGANLLGLFCECGYCISFSLSKQSVLLFVGSALQFTLLASNLLWICVMRAGVTRTIYFQKNFVVKSNKLEGKFVDWQVTTTTCRSQKNIPYAEIFHDNFD